MMWPKRYRLHEAVASRKVESPYQMDVVQAHGKYLVAVDGPGLALLPVLETNERMGADLPRLETGEEAPFGVLPPKAFQEASQGTSGVGRIQVAHDTVEAQRAQDRPVLRFERPDRRELPPISDVLDQVDREGPVVELCLDAEALVRLSRAIGAGEAVRLCFQVDSKGRCSAQEGTHGLIDIRDARDPLSGARAVLGAFLI